MGVAGIMDKSGPPKASGFSTQCFETAVFSRWGLLISLAAFVLYVVVWAHYTAASFLTSCFSNELLFQALSFSTFAIESVMDTRSRSTWDCVTTRTNYSSVDCRGPDLLRFDVRYPVYSFYLHILIFLGIYVENIFFFLFCLARRSCSFWIFPSPSKLAVYTFWNYPAPQKRTYWD
jgi:hypothetical protein